MPYSYTNTASNVFFRKQKGTQEEQTAVTTKSLTVAVRRLGLQAAGKALPWALSTSHHLFWDADPKD